MHVLHVGYSCFCRVDKLQYRPSNTKSLKYLLSGPLQKGPTSVLEDAYYKCGSWGWPPWFGPLERMCEVPGAPGMQEETKDLGSPGLHSWGTQWSMVYPEHRLGLEVEGLGCHCLPGDCGGHGWRRRRCDSCLFRSEERRVGKECRSRWSPYH